MVGRSEVIPYTTGDYKKYVYAQGKHRVSRIREIVAALEGSDGFNIADAEDLDSLLVNVVYVLWRAAFVDDHRQDDCAQWRIAWPPTHPVPDPEPEEERALKAADTYSDGRPVTTTFRYGNAEDEYVTHVWHPDPPHPDNRPGAVLESSQGPFPFRFRHVAVTAPGVIDTYEVDDEDLPR
jgi:hypothetical protein